MALERRGTDIKVFLKNLSSYSAPGQEGDLLSNRFKQDDPALFMKKKRLSPIRIFNLWIFTKMARIAEPTLFKLRRYLLEPIFAELSGVQNQLEKLAESLKATKADPPILEVKLAESISNRLSLLADDTNAAKFLSSIAAQRFALGVSGGNTLVRTSLGYVLVPEGDVATIAMLAEDGAIESGTRKFIEGFLISGDTFVDIGAHIGLHSIAAAKVVGKYGKIMSFEPTPSTFECLKENIELNGFHNVIHPKPHAVSGGEGVRPFVVRKNSTLNSLFGEPWLNQGAEKAVLEVETVSLATAMKDLNKIALIKIDAEGSEFEIVNGGKSWLREFPDVGLVVEFGPSNFLAAGVKPSDFLDLLDSLEFEYKVIDELTGALLERTREELLTSFSVNLFASKHGSKAWARVL